MTDYSGIKKYATVRQAEILDAVELYGSQRQAAKALGVNKSTVQGAVKAVEARAAIKGKFGATDLDIPDPYYLAKRTVHTIVDQKTGARVEAQSWDRWAPDTERMVELVKTFVQSLVEHVKPAPATKAPESVNEDLLCVYPLGDPHFGLYSWAEETGDDFSLDEAERVTKGAIDWLVSSAPSSKQAILLNLGDYFHADDSKNATPGHGNVLDVDTRYGKVMKVGLDSLIHCVDRLLEKHEQVAVWNIPGNHDPHASFALALAMASHYRNEPRVEVPLRSSLYWYHEFGKNLIASHHGHGAKPADLPLVMAADVPDMWGRTQHRVWHCGHIHHKTYKEHPGCDVETHRTLAGKDAWHAGKGYRSKRDSNVIVYHREFGEVQRTRCDIQMIASFVS